MASVITRDHASFSYDGKEDIFTDLTYEISSENIFCILGPNGIGKSTLLNAIMDLLPLHEGRVLIDGRPVQSYRRAALAKKVAYIPQTYQMTFPYNVLDLVLMGRTPHLNDMNRPSQCDYEKVMEAVTSLGIEDLLDRTCTQLSGGQLQMVMLARAIAQEAEFLLLDEPTSHLDFGKEMETLRMLVKMHRRGVGILFTTHNPNHAFMVCDSVAIMDKGSFTCVGSPEEIVTEENLSRIYGTPVQIVPYGKSGTHRTCVAADADADSWR